MKTTIPTYSAPGRLNTRLRSIRPWSSAFDQLFLHAFDAVTRALAVRRIVRANLRADMHRGGGHRAARRAGLPIRETGFFGGLSPRMFRGLA